MLDTPSQGLAFLLLLSALAVALGGLWVSLSAPLRRSGIAVERRRRVCGAALLIASACAVWLTARYPLFYEVHGGGTSVQERRMFEWYLWSGRVRELRAEFDSKSGRLLVESPERGRFNHAGLPSGLVVQWFNAPRPIMFWERHIQGRYAEAKANIQ